MKTDHIGQGFRIVFLTYDRCIIEEMTDIKQKLGQTLFPAPLHDT